LTRLCVSLTQVQNALKSTGIGPNERLLLKQQREQFQPMISSLLDIKKALESDVSTKRKDFSNSNKQFKEVRQKKKIDTPILVASYKTKKFLLQYTMVVSLMALIAANC
jgi:hypothetical protein